MARDATTWAADHGAALEGESPDTAAARVRDAGLTPRILAPGAVVTLEHRPDRITLQTDERGVVTAVRPG